MQLFKSVIASFFILSMAGTSYAQQPSNDITISPQPVQRGYFLTGPHTHKNLSVYLIHNKAQVKRAEYVPLEEALEKVARTIRYYLSE